MTDDSDALKSVCLFFRVLVARSLLVMDHSLVTVTIPPKRAMKSFPSHLSSKEQEKRQGLLSLPYSTRFISEMYHPERCSLGSRFGYP